MSDTSQSRYSTALAGLGAILGVDRTGTRDEYLEDLRLAAALMRFDLEAMRSEADRIAGIADTPDDGPFNPGDFEDDVA